jgi:tetratricopeptide (TPR) repeat protein
MRWLIGLACLISVLASPARAKDRAKAKQLFAAAQQHYKLGEFDQALEGFKEVYRNFEDPSLLYNIAQCERQLGRKPDAVRSYKMFLSEVPGAPNREEIEHTISSLEQSIKEEADAAAAAAAAEAARNAPPPVVVQAPPPPPPPPKHTWWMIGVGAGLLGLGAVGIATGAVAVVKDGKGSCSLTGTQTQCPSVYNTKAEGGALLGVGIAALLGGAVLIGIEEKRFHTPVRAAIDISPNRVGLALSGAF